MPPASALLLGHAVVLVKLRRGIYRDAIEPPSDSGQYQYRRTSLALSFTSASPSSGDGVGLTSISTTSIHRLSPGFVSPAPPTALPSVLSARRGDPAPRVVTSRFLGRVLGGPGHAFVVGPVHRVDLVAHIQLQRAVPCARTCVPDAGQHWDHAVAVLRSLRLENRLAVLTGMSIATTGPMCVTGIRAKVDPVPNDAGASVVSVGASQSNVTVVGGAASAARFCQLGRVR